MYYYVIEKSWSNLYDCYIGIRTNNTGNADFNYSIKILKNDNSYHLIINLFKDIMKSNKIALLNLAHPILGKAAKIKLKYKNEIKFGRYDWLIHSSEDLNFSNKELKELFNIDF